MSGDELLKQSRYEYDVGYAECQAGNYEKGASQFTSSLEYLAAAQLSGDCSHDESHLTQLSSHVYECLARAEESQDDIELAQSWYDTPDN